jgi:hypothetical protein
MNRRNFILGLGTAATLSGAASVTGASISGTADASANFQVIAENDLNVQRNSGISEAGNGELLNSTSDNYVNTTVGYVGTDANDEEGYLNTTDGSGYKDVGGPRLTVNGQEDGNLRLALTAPNDASTGSGDPYDSGSGGTAPLEIVNNGATDKTISTEFTYGGGIENNGSGSAGDDTLDSGDVAELFQFSIGGSQISPDRTDPGVSGDSGTNTNQATVTAGTSEVVDFTINYTSDIANDISQAASGSGDYDFANNELAAVNLLNTVTFGEVQ